jgi:hypothetical protein
MLNDFAASQLPPVDMLDLKSFMCRFNLDQHFTVVRHRCYTLVSSSYCTSLNDTAGAKMSTARAAPTAKCFTDRSNALVRPPWFRLGLSMRGYR